MLVAISSSKTMDGSCSIHRHTDTDTHTHNENGRQPDNVLLSTYEGMAFTELTQELASGTAYLCRQWSLLRVGPFVMC